MCLRWAAACGPRQYNARAAALRVRLASSAAQDSRPSTLIPMLIFWSIAALLVAVTLAVHRDQKRALDAELADGVISAEEHEAAMAELSRRLGEDVGAPGEPVPPTSPRKRTWVFAVALLV